MLSKEAAAQACLNRYRRCSCKWTACPHPKLSTEVPAFARKQFALLRFPPFLNVFAGFHNRGDAESWISGSTASTFNGGGAVLSVKTEPCAVSSGSFALSPTSPSSSSLVKAAASTGGSSQGGSSICDMPSSMRRVMEATGEDTSDDILLPKSCAPFCLCYCCH